MTKEQAIKELRISECYSVMPSVEALDMAIKALEQQPTDETIKYLECNDIDVQKFTESMKRQRLQAVQPNSTKLIFDMMNRPTSNDCVSRQAVLDLAVDYGTNSATFLIPVCSVKNLPPVTPTHGTCKDCHNNVRNYGNGRIYCLFSNCIYDEDFWCKKFEK